MTAMSPRRTRLVEPTHSRAARAPRAAGVIGHSVRIDALRPGESPWSSVIALQRTVGNRVAGQMLAAVPASPLSRVGNRPIEAPPRLPARVLQRHGAFDPAQYPPPLPSQLTLPGLTMRQENANLVAAGLRERHLPSDVLRAELIGAGVPDPTGVVGNQAHHIVERNDPNAALARAYLRAVDIDLDAAANGVFLPTVRSDDAPAAAIHLGRHIAEYAWLVSAALTRAINATGVATAQVLGPLPLTPAEQMTVRTAILACLARIRELLLRGDSSLNRGYNTDSAYAPNPGDRDAHDKSPEGGSLSLRADFERAGLI